MASPRRSAHVSRPTAWGVAAAGGLSFRAGESFPHDRRLPEGAEAREFVGGAEPGGNVGTQWAMECGWWQATYLKPNALCLGAHVGQCRLCVAGTAGV